MPHGQGLPRQLRVCSIISDHGYGHAARSCALLKELIATRGELVAKHCQQGPQPDNGDTTKKRHGHRVDIDQYLIVTGVDPKFVYESIGGRSTDSHSVRIERTVVDVGVWQRDALVIDVHQTLLKLREFWCVPAATTSPGSTTSLSHWFGQPLVDLLDRGSLVPLPLSPTCASLAAAAEADVGARSLAYDKILHLVDCLRRFKPTLILYDMCAVAPIVGSIIGVPTVACGNFTWDWIYESYGREFAPFISLHRRAYSLSTHFLKLPYTPPSVDESFIRQGKRPTCALGIVEVDREGGVEATPRLDARVPSSQIGGWLGRVSSLERQTVRSLLGLGSEAPLEARDGSTTTTTRDSLTLLFFSFGGHDFPLLDCIKATAPLLPPHWAIVAVVGDLEAQQDMIVVVDKLVMSSSSSSSSSQCNSRIFPVCRSDMERSNITYVDLLSAMDLCVAKTGYGIVAECIMHNIPVLYVDRPGFREHKYLVDALRHHIPCREIKAQELVSGAIVDHAKEVLSEQRERSDTVEGQFPFDGARKGAEWICRFAAI